MPRKIGSKDRQKRKSRIGAGKILLGAGALGLGAYLLTKGKKKKPTKLSLVETDELLPPAKRSKVSIAPPREIGKKEQRKNLLYTHLVNNDLLDLETGKLKTSIRDEYIAGKQKYYKARSAKAKEYGRKRSEKKAFLQKSGAGPAYKKDQRFNMTKDLYTTENLVGGTIKDRTERKKRIGFSQNIINDNLATFMAINKKQKTTKKTDTRKARKERIAFQIAAAGGEPNMAMISRKKR